MVVHPKVSIVIPYHEFPGVEYFIKRAIDSIVCQTYKNYEIVFTKDGKMAENTNSGIRRAKGDIIKVLYVDDYLAHAMALESLVNAFDEGWLVTACTHDPGGQVHIPETSGLVDNLNSIGSPSVLAFENDHPLMFDTSMTWLLDVDYYKRLFKRYGLPTILPEVNVAIGLHAEQMTHKLGDDIKTGEHLYLRNKYEN